MKESKNIPIPISTLIDDIITKDNEIVTIVEINMKLYRSKIFNKFIKKTLTIPEYLNVLGIENNIDFSETLREALMKKLNL